MASETLTNLLARVRSRADMVGSTFVADDTNNMYAWVNEGCKRLHGKLVEAMGEEYVSSSASLTTVAGTTDYAVPTGFFKLYGIDLSIAGQSYSLKPYMRAERNAYRNLAYITSVTLPRYSIVGGYFRLLPAPGAGTGTVYYAPEFTSLTSGSDTVNFPNGWEAYVVLYAAIQALMKEESSVTDLRRELDSLERELEYMKECRDYAMPKQAVNMDIVDYPGW